MSLAVVVVPASIPSPSSGTLTLGPLSLNAYGLMIALGVIAAVWLLGKRLEDKGIGSRDDANAIALWSVLAGVVGARMYHVLTDWQRFEGNYGDIVKIWEGGLGIPGGLVLGAVAGTFVCYKRGLPLGQTANAVAPTVALAQGIGRWGNYFNQELFGGPTDLPWALEIDAANIPPGYAAGTTFHPTFLYESLSNLALCGLLLWIDKRFQPAGGRLMAMYVAGYGFIRFWVEGLRIDEADEFGPFRWNQWVALAAFAGGVAYLLATRHKPKDVLVAAPSGAPADGEPALDDAAVVENPDAPTPASPSGDEDDDGPIEDAELVDDDSSIWAEDPAPDPADDPADDQVPKDPQAHETT